MNAPAPSRPMPPFSVCDACDGEFQKRYEALTFSGATRDWLCASCRVTLLAPAEPTAVTPVVGEHIALDCAAGESCPR